MFLLLFQQLLLLLQQPLLLLQQLLLLLLPWLLHHILIPQSSQYLLQRAVPTAPVWRLSVAAAPAAAATASAFLPSLLLSQQKLLNFYPLLFMLLRVPLWRQLILLILYDVRTWRGDFNAHCRSYSSSNCLKSVEQLGFRKGKT